MRLGVLGMVGFDGLSVIEVSLSQESKKSVQLRKFAKK